VQRDRQSATGCGGSDYFNSLLGRHFPPLREALKSAPEDEIAGRYRDRNGGNVLFRPAGMMVVVDALCQLVTAGMSLDEAARRLASAPMELTAPLWAGLLWDTGNRRMISAPENQDVATRILLYAVGGAIGEKLVDERALKVEAAGLLNMPPDAYKLPRFVEPES
jgi:hypothetical protein